MNYSISAAEAIDLSIQSNRLIPKPTIWMMIRECARLGGRSISFEANSLSAELERELKQLKYKFIKEGSTCVVSW